MKPIWDNLCKYVYYSIIFIGLTVFDEIFFKWSWEKLLSISILLNFCSDVLFILGYKLILSIPTKSILSIAEKIG